MIFPENNKFTSIDNENVITAVKAKLVIDIEGNMVTGWVKTVDGKTYFFENAKTIDEGKMVTGWKQIQNDWYFFAADGVMLVNTTTPDGYLVGADGKMMPTV